MNLTLTDKITQTHKWMTAVCHGQMAHVSSASAVKTFSHLQCWVGHRASVCRPAPPLGWTQSVAPAPSVSMPQTQVWASLLSLTGHRTPEKVNTKTNPLWSSCYLYNVYIKTTHNVNFKSWSKHALFLEGSHKTIKMSHLCKCCIACLGCGCLDYSCRHEQQGGGWNEQRSG